MIVYPNTSTRVEDATLMTRSKWRGTQPRLHERNVLAQSPYPWCVHCTAGRGVGQRDAAVEEQRTLLLTIMSDYMSGESDVSGATRSCRREQLAESGVDGQVLKDHWSESFPTSGV